MKRGQICGFICSVCPDPSRSFVSKFANALSSGRENKNALLHTLCEQECEKRPAHCFVSRFTKPANSLGPHDGSNIVVMRAKVLTNYTTPSQTPIFCDDEPTTLRCRAAVKSCLVKAADAFTSTTSIAFPALGNSPQCQI